MSTFLHYSRSIYSHYKNLHYKRSTSSHCKINIIGDTSVPIRPTNLYYKRSTFSISNSESIDNRRCRPLISLQSSNITSTNHIFSETRLYPLSPLRPLVAEKLSSENGILDHRQVRNFKFCIRTLNVKTGFLAYLFVVPMTPKWWPSATWIFTN